MSQWGWGEKIALGAVIIAIITIAANGVVTPEVRCWLKLKSDVCSSEAGKKDNDPSPLPTPNSSPPSTTPLPVEVSPTPTKEPSAETSPPTSPSPIPTQEPANISSTPVIEALNCNSSNIGVLKTTCSFNDRVSSSKQEQYYFFRLDSPSNVSLYLDKVTNQVKMSLYVDTNGNGVIDSNEGLESSYAYSSRPGVIKQTLGVDKYIVVVQFGGGNSDYNLQIINNTSEAVNVGLLKGHKAFSGFVGRTKREKYYRFNLSSTSNISLSLDKVINQVKMFLCVDTNGNGVIDNNECLDTAYAYSSRPAIIKKTLGADNYFVVVQQKGGNTEYNLTMSSP